MCPECCASLDAGFKKPLCCVAKSQNYVTATSRCVHVDAHAPVVQVHVCGDAHLGHRSSPDAHPPFTITNQQGIVLGVPGQAGGGTDTAELKTTTRRVTHSQEWYWQQLTHTCTAAKRCAPGTLLHASGANLSNLRTGAPCMCCYRAMWPS